MTAKKPTAAATAKKITKAKRAVKSALAALEGSTKRKSPKRKTAKRKTAKRKTSKKG